MPVSHFRRLEERLWSFLSKCFSFFFPEVGGDSLVFVCYSGHAIWVCVFAFMQNFITEAKKSVLERLSHCFF